MIEYWGSLMTAAGGGPSRGQERGTVAAVMTSGSIQLHDHYRPGLAAGTYTITASQVVTGSGAPS
ncbi:MAG: hypothetical protein ACREMY_14985, partial [bacterium]